MKLQQSIADLICKQVTAEFYSAYLYLSMAAYCDTQRFKGFANWMQVQAQEELAHGTHLYQYLLDREVMPLFGEIKAPPLDFASLTDVFEKVLRHEQGVTESIHHIASVALQNNDHATYACIQWYVTEQIEEESSAEEVLQKLKMIGDNLSMLYTLDSELASRVFVDPFASAK